MIQLTMKTYFSVVLKFEIFKFGLQFLSIAHSCNNLSFDMIPLACRSFTIDSIREINLQKNSSSKN